MRSMIVVGPLRWNPRNIAHIARHGVLSNEVDDVCGGDYLVRQAYEGRLMLIGPTATGRMLAVVLEFEGEDAVYPVTARPASRKERRLYQQRKGRVHDDQT
jgi:uncharacterized DUF497 family protein